MRNRTKQLYINDGYTDDDEITYKIPPGYRTDLIPLNVTITKPFGTFKATMELKGDQLVFKRNIQVFDGTFDKELYADFVEFYQAVADADNYNVTLVKNWSAEDNNA